MKTYAVRQKSTGLFIPRFKKGCKAGTWLEPSNDLEPRLFHNKQSARSFLGNWLQGRMVGKTDNNLENPERYIHIEKCPERKKEDMEIVEFDMIEIK